MGSEVANTTVDDSSPSGSELHDLCASLCDGVLTEEREQLLGEILKSSPDARRTYLRYVALHSTFLATGGQLGPTSEYEARLAVERLAIERFAGRLTTDEALPASVQPKSGHPTTLLRRAIQGALAASLLVVAGWAALHADLPPKGPTAASVTEMPAPLPSLIDNTLIEPVAEVTFVADSVVWRNPNASYARSSRVRTGDVLAFHQGKMELTYTNGSRLLLAGPSEFVVRADGGQLRLGELVARVPKSGHGFTIETPQGKVVDLGTEFGVVVDDFGISQVSVFEGKVETTPHAEAGSGRPPIELTSGKAIQWDGSSFVPITFQGRRHRLPGDRAHDRESGIDTLDSPWVIELGGGAINSKNWRWIGDASPTDASAALLRGKGLTTLPYVITASQLDPDKGAVTVVCDLRFVEPVSASEATFTLLTRAASTPSTAGKAWEGQLARGVRCRLRADLASGEVRLEAGAKQEADREPTNISWGGFTRQVPGTRYRLQMRDDGLNVTFTVSIADNPSLSKTITCRSLFRGDENFVAIEGPAECDAIVERLTVRQDCRTPNDHGLVSQGLSRNPTSGEPSAADLSDLLDSLAPMDAQLILRDTFDGASLDPQRWTTLGEVSLGGGNVRIGKGNPTGHINTWHRRPYLLTAKTFDWSRTSVSVVGSVTFAENFLHGYGGSFAVMTRASDEHSDAPAWENSILSQGVRSNFWPAAFGFDHSLELHEKRLSEQIKLLVADSFPAPPRSRRYAFQVVDDGENVSATFIDAENVSVRKTVRGMTSGNDRTTGRIGLESCWGSPVEIDEVRVYIGSTESDSQ